MELVKSSKKRVVAEYSLKGEPFLVGVFGAKNPLKTTLKDEYKDVIKSLRIASGATGLSSIDIVIKATIGMEVNSLVTETPREPWDEVDVNGLMVFDGAVVETSDGFIPYKIIKIEYSGKCKFVQTGEGMFASASPAVDVNLKIVASDDEKLVCYEDIFDAYVALKK